MNVEAFFKGQSADSLNYQLHNLRLSADQLWAEHEALMAEVNAYEVPGYKEFKKVLTKEKIRVAFKRMTIPIDDVDSHNQIRGQFYQLVKLEEKKEDIYRDLFVNNAKIREISSKSEKLEKQLKAHSERK